MCMKSMNLIIMMNFMLNITTWSLFFVKQRLDELEHTDLITEWTSNVYKYAYKKNLKKAIKKKTTIAILAGTTFQRSLNKSYCGSYFRMF